MTKRRDESREKGNLLDVGWLALGVWAYRAQCTEGRLWLVGSDPCAFANNRVGKSRLICSCYLIVNHVYRRHTSHTCDTPIISPIYFSIVAVTIHLPHSLSSEE